MTAVANDIIDKSGDIRTVRLSSLQSQIDGVIEKMQEEKKRGARIEAVINRQEYDIIIGVSPLNNLSVVAAYRGDRLNDDNWEARLTGVYTW